LENSNEIPNVQNRTRSASEKDISMIGKVDRIGSKRNEMKWRPYKRSDLVAINLSSDEQKAEQIEENLVDSGNKEQSVANDHQCKVNSKSQVPINHSVDSVIRNSVDDRVKISGKYVFDSEKFVENVAHMYDAVMVDSGVKPVNQWNGKGVTLADKIKGKTDSKIVLSFKAPVVLEDGRQVIRFSKEVVQEGAKTNSLVLVAHFVGISMPFFVVNDNLNRLWKKYGLVNVASNYQGYYLLKFNNEKGMEYVLENGPWMINRVPLFVKKWEVGYYLGKPELKKLPLWVNLYGVPLEVWNVQGLSELASGIGVPLALDRATEERDA